MLTGFRTHAERDGSNSAVRDDIAICVPPPVPILYQRDTVSKSCLLPLARGTFRDTDHKTDGVRP